MRDMTISEIERLTYKEAKENAIEVIKIKEHDCVFINFEGYFGYSVLVFKNGKHIYYANDYQLHHSYTVKERGLDGLRDYYIAQMNRKLYTNEELLEEIESYDEYDKKSYFLRNYWIMQYDYLSIFRFGREQEMKFEKAKKYYPYSNPVSFCYVKDESIVEEQLKYHVHISSQYEKLKNNISTFREMISKELANHEAGYTGEIEDTLDALNMKWDELSEEKQKIVKEELKKQMDW